MLRCASSLGQHCAAHPPPMLLWSDGAWRLPSVGGVSGLPLLGGEEEDLALSAAALLEESTVYQRKPWAPAVRGSCLIKVEVGQRN